MGFKKQLAQSLELPKEVVLGLPLICLTGNEEMTIENHKGLLEYAPEGVRIASGSGSLYITGEGLALRQMSAECIVVTGVIHSIEFLR